MAKAVETVDQSVTVTSSPLEQEKERTGQLLTRFRESAPERGRWDRVVEYSSKTLKGRARSFPYGHTACLFIHSLTDFLDKDREGRVNVLLRFDDYSHSNHLRIGWPADVSVGVTVNWNGVARARLDAQAFSYLPAPYELRDRGITAELANQTYSNAILELLIDDLDANRVDWIQDLQDKREQYFALLQERRGEMWEYGQ